MARGLTLEYAGTEFNGEARIEASGKQSAVGVWAGTRTLVDFNDHAVIKTTATGGEEYEEIPERSLSKTVIPMGRPPYVSLQRC